MPVEFKNKRFYRTNEVCKKVGISRSTLCRWLKTGILEDTARRDRRGWRLYADYEIKIIEEEAQRLR